VHLADTVTHYTRSYRCSYHVGSVVIAVSLWAIFAHQTSRTFIHWSALAFAIHAVICVFKVTWVRTKRWVRTNLKCGNVALPDEEEAQVESCCFLVFI